MWRSAAFVLGIRRVLLSCFVLVLGCGRLGFDSQSLGGDASGDAALDGAADAADDSAPRGDVGLDGARDSMMVDAGPPPTSAVASWAVSFGGVGDERAEKLGVDADGNIYSGGYFEGTIDPGGGPIVSVEGRDAFFVSFARNGDFRWARQFGGVGEQRAAGAGALPGGRVVVVGGYEGSVDFGGGPEDAGGAQAMFISAHDGATGAHAWTQTFAGTMPNYLEPLSISSRGTILTSHAFFGDVSVGGARMSAGPMGSVLLAEHDAAGAHRTSFAHGGAAAEVGSESVAQDAAGNFYAAGGFASGSADFGAGAVANRGNQDGWVASWTAAGELRWATQIAGAQRDLVESIAVSNTGDVYAGGFFYGTLMAGDEAITATDGSDAFLVKLRSDGSVAWARAFGGVGFDEIETLTVDGAGDLYIGGSFDTAVDVGGGVLGSLGMADIYIARLGPDGEHRWSKSFGSTGADAVRGIAPDGSGNVAIVGYLGGPADFDGNVVPHAGGEDAFVAGLREM